MNAQAQPALRGYHPLIAEATGYTDVATLQRIEDCMRDTIFHSTLDWQSREDFDRGARDAVDVLLAMGAIEPLPLKIEPITVRAVRCTGQQEAPPTATLYYFEYVGNNLGVWERSWHSGRVAAETAHLAKAHELCVDPDEEGRELTGEYGDLTEVREAKVPLTPEGVLAFANEYGLGGLDS